jgi:hypothetical protein
MSYTLRTDQAANLDVDVQKDGGPEVGDEGWTITASAPFSGSDFTEADVGDATPVTGPIRDGREYQIEFDAESGYTTPTASNITASGTPQTFTGDYEEESGATFFESIEQVPGNSAPWGWDDLVAEAPWGNVVQHNPPTGPNDSLGASIGRVLASTFGGGSGYAIRHYLHHNSSVRGARAQSSLYDAGRTALQTMMTSGNHFYVYEEYFIPVLFTISGNQEYFSFNDFHCVGSSRWHTNPGLMLKRKQTGEMYFETNWNGAPNSNVSSTMELPVGQWFGMEIQYKWTYSTDCDYKIWISDAGGDNAVLALNNPGCFTIDGSHDGHLEFYSKAYCSSDTPAVYSINDNELYKRNCKIRDARYTSP